MVVREAGKVRRVRVTVIREVGNVPKVRVTVIREAGNVPKVRVTVIREMGNVPKLRVTVIREVGKVPKLRVTVIRRSGTFPSLRVTVVWSLGMPLFLPRAVRISAAWQRWQPEWADEAEGTFITRGKSIRHHSTTRPTQPVSQKDLASRLLQV